MEAAQKQFFDAFEAVKIKPDPGATVAWDPAMVVVYALRHLDPDPSAAQVRDYIARLKGFGGINGLYDFPKIPQRGLNIDDVVVTRWSPARETGKSSANRRESRSADNQLQPTERPSSGRARSPAEA